jgi:hypothetical protein
MDFSDIQNKLGFTEDDKARWLESNGKYYSDPEQGWKDKLMMHAFPKRSASVYVMPAYQSPITGKWIDTPSQRRDDLKRNNSRPWEGMAVERKVAQDRVKAEAKAEDQALEIAAVAAWHSLGDDKKKMLESSI